MPLHGVEAISFADAKVIATPQSTTLATYTALTTPDVVEGVVVPEDGQLFVIYRALWKAANVGEIQGAAIFLDDVQLKTVMEGAEPEVTESQAVKTMGAAVYLPVMTHAKGLRATDFGAGETTLIDTGQVWALGDGGLVCVIDVAAGTYDVSIRFKTDGTVTVKDRKLHVWVMGF